LRAVRKTSERGSVGGRPATEYWLTEWQALRVCMWSEAPRADAVQGQTTVGEGEFTAGGDPTRRRPAAHALVDNRGRGFEPRAPQGAVRDVQGRAQAVAHAFPGAPAVDPYPHRPATEDAPATAPAKADRARRVEPTSHIYRIDLVEDLPRHRQPLYGLLYGADRKTLAAQGFSPPVGARTATPPPPS
jgi:hypothetical protein